MDITSFVLGLKKGIASAKVETQEKTVDITENGTTEITPDDGYALSKVTVNANVAGGGSTEKVIYAEETWTTYYHPNYGAYVLGQNFSETVPVFPLALGDECIVVWDGEEYTVTVGDSSSVMPGSLFVGNGSSIGLPGNNEPFIVAWASEGVTFFALTDTEQTEHTVRIYQKSSAVKTQEKTVDITANGEMEILPDEGYALSKVIANVFVSGSGGEWLYAEGDVTPAEDGSVTVTHSLGVMPDIIMVLKNTGQITSTNSKNYVINGLYLSEKLLGAGQENYGTVFVYTPSSKYFMVGGASKGLEHITSSYYAACCDVTSQTMKLGTNSTPLLGGSAYSWYVYAKK